MADWDEIRKLAADLQRAQLSGSVQKLSERYLLVLALSLSCQSLKVLFYFWVSSVKGLERAQFFKAGAGLSFEFHSWTSLKFKYFLTYNEFFPLC